MEQRKRLRKEAYDYSTPNDYFVTICTKNLKNYFGKIIDGDLYLNEAGKIVSGCINQISCHYPMVLINASVIMPNHIHLIIEIKAEDIRPLLGNIVKGFKIGCSKQLKEKLGIAGIWQRSFHDHIIRNEKSFLKIEKYISNNPIQWEQDTFYQK